jgi:hypothetical protein
MQFLRCPSCGFSNETVDTACARCGADISRVVPEDAEVQAVAGSFASGKQAWASASASWNAAAGDDFPFARRFAMVLRAFAKINYWLSLVGLAIGVLVMLIGGFALPSGSVLEKAGLAFGGVFGAVILAVFGFLFIWLTYIALMAVPDIILCHLAIERNTRS